MVCEERENNHPVHKSHASLRTCIYTYMLHVTCTCTVAHACPGMLLCPLEESVLYKGTAYQLRLLAGLFSSVGRASAYKAESRGFKSHRSPLFLPLSFHHWNATVCLSVCLSASLPKHTCIHVYVHTCMYMYMYTYV